MICSFGSNQTDGCEGDEVEVSICGADSEGLLYRQRGHKIRCNVNGQWESVCDKSPVSEPICVAQPCPEIEVANAETITYSTDPLSEHYNEGTEGNLTECEERYVPLSSRDQTVCDAGEWSVQLECTLRDQTCSIDDLQLKAQSIAHFESIDTSCPGGEKKDDENVFGGESCPLKCTASYYLSGRLVCRQGEWDGSSAICGEPFRAHSIKLLEYCKTSPSSPYALGYPHLYRERKELPEIRG